MASPTEDAVALNSKPAPAKDQKDIVNGQVTEESNAEAPEAEAPKADQIESKSKAADEPQDSKEKTIDLVMNGKPSDDTATNGTAVHEIRPSKKEDSEPRDVPMSKVEDERTKKTPTPAEAKTPTKEEPREEKEKSSEEKSSEEKSSEEKPAKEMPTEEKSTEEKPAVTTAEKDAEKDAEKSTEKSAEKPIEKVEDEEATKPDTTTQSEDVTMTDVANDANDVSEPPREDDSSKPSSAPEPKSPAKSTLAAEPSPDHVMDDKPAEEVEAAIKAEEAPSTSEADKGPTPPAETSPEVAMPDAPSSKISREREEDLDDEPMAKRAKTEQKEEETANSAVGTPAPGPEAVNRLASLPKWEEKETDKKPITVHQRREVRKIIARVKKTKHGGHFRDAVMKLWPQLGDSYLTRIEKPMDLSQIDRNIRDPSGIYSTFGDLRKDLSLIYENTMTFNGAAHEVTSSAFFAIRAVWQEALLIPEEEPTRPKSVAKPKPLRDPRSPTGTDLFVRRQSSGPASSPPREAPEPKPRPPPAQESHASDRRGSTATDPDRPKRTVRAPKPKDIDYTKPSRKKLKPELQFCDEVLAELMHPKNQVLNTWFMDAVDAEGLNIPDYYSIIKKPMDLGKVSRMLSNGDISSLKDFDRSVKLIFANCYQFNGPPQQGNPVSLTAKQLEDLYVQQMKGKDAWLSRYAKANAPAPSASHESDEEEEDESDDGGERAVPSVDYSKEVQEYSTKLEEESKKLNSLFASGAQQSLIDCQKVIVEALQGALHKAAQALSEAKPKQEKSSKKASKASKNKTSSQPTHRKSLSGIPSTMKKPPVPKKPAPKKTLSAADKDAIASAINDLESAHLDRAIDIIKRDTGQNENNEGELELDIDQLSNEALLKLWDLCKKVLPGFGKSLAPAKSPEVTKSSSNKATPKSASKPKKNKPMSAQEQEARIAQLTAISQMYKSGQEPSESALAGSPTAGDSSDDSDSEEE